MTQPALDLWTQLITGTPIKAGSTPRIGGRLDLRYTNSVKPNAISTYQTDFGVVSELSEVKKIQRVSWAGLDFSESRLSNLRIFDSKIEDCVFAKCIMEDLRVWNTLFEGVSFEGADLSGGMLGTFRREKYNKYAAVDFSLANMSGTLYKVAEFSDCLFRNSILDKVDFQGSIFEECVFTGELREVMFYDRSFEVAETPVNEMRNVDFRGAKLRWCSFRNLNLDSVIFPAGDDHIVVSNYPEVIDILLNKFHNCSEVEWKRLVAVLKDSKKWLGPSQKRGFFNINDLADIVGHANVALILDLIRDAGEIEH